MHLSLWSQKSSDWVGSGWCRRYQSRWHTWQPGEWKSKWRNWSRPCNPSSWPNGICRVGRWDFCPLRSVSCSSQTWESIPPGMTPASKGPEPTIFFFAWWLSCICLHGRESVSSQQKLPMGWGEMELDCWDSMVISTKLYWIWRQDEQRKTQQSSLGTFLKKYNLQYIRSILPRASLLAQW